MRPRQESVSDEAQLAPTQRASVIVSAISLLLAPGILFCAALPGTEFARIARSKLEAKLWRALWDSTGAGRC